MTISLENVGSGFKRSVINDNFTAIQDEINNNLLNKNGGTPLTADLDANSNDLLNVGTVQTSSIVLNGDILTVDNTAVSTLPPQAGKGGYVLSTNGSVASWEDRDDFGMLLFDSVAALKLDSLESGRLVATKQYYSTELSVGSAVYLIMTPAEFVDTPDEIVDHTLSNGNIAKLQFGESILVSQAGASSTILDNSTRIQAVIDKLSASGGGVLTSDLSERYPIQNELDLKSDVTVKDVKLSCDFTLNPDYAIAGQGSLGTPTTITSDISEGATSISVSSVAGFSEGSYLIIKDPTRVGGRWPWTVAEILDITGLVITIRQPVGVEYLLANSCTVTPLSPVVGARLDNVDMSYTATGTSKFGVYFNNSVGCGTRDLKVKDHSYTSNPTACVSLRVDNSLEFESNNSFITHNTNTVGGNAAIVFGVTSSKVDNVFSQNASFGVGLWYSYGIVSSGHTVSGRRASGNRGAKMAGCQQCKFVNVSVNNFDSGIKIEDSGQFGVIGCTVSNCGLGSSSYGINVSHINAPSSADIRPSVLQSNTVYSTNGTGIFLDANSRQCAIDGNTVRKATQGGILCLAADVTISDNFVFDWQAGAGIKFVGTDVVTGNNLVGLTVSTDSFELNAQPSETDWTVFSNNKCATHGITTNPTWFERVAVSEGNAVLDWGGRVMFGSAAPTGGTFTRGDKVYDNSPSASGSIGWVCTGSGTPGVWKTFGGISA